MAEKRISRKPDRKTTLLHFLIIHILIVLPGSAWLGLDLWGFIRRTAVFEGVLRTEKITVSEIQQGESKKVLHDPN
ncbi:MAG: hypothetical protein D6772_04985 [Bacteroidetes bacterium]|nr:MAG: hypothetical protein D6772_04985 [Bacteroidota bacterium]